MSIFNRKKIKDFFVYGFGQAINILSPLLVLPYLVHVCGIEQVGKVGVGMSVALILNSIIDYGSYIKGVKDISINRDNHPVLERNFNAIYFSKLILFCLIFIITVLALLLVPYLRQEQPLFLLSLSIVVGQLINPAWFFQGVENFKWISIVNLLSKTIYLVLVFVFIRQKGDYILANFFFGLGAIVANSFGLIWLMRRYRFSFGNANLAVALRVLKDEFSFSLSQVFLSVYQFFPIILVSYFGGDLMAGQFRVIDQIVSLFKTYLNMFFYFVYANICYELDKSYTMGIKAWKQYNGLNFIMLFVMMAFIYCFAPLILTYFKIDNHGLDPMVGYLRLALLIPLLISVSLPLRQLMFAFDLNRIYIAVTISTTILNLLLLAAMTATLGLKGAFLSIVIIEAFVITLYSIILTRTAKKRAIHTQ